MSLGIVHGSTIGLQRGNRLKTGDIVCIVAPAGPFDRDEFFNGLEKLREWGLEPHWREDIFSNDRYLAGSDDRRRAELFDALSDEQVRAVFCARGGYGSMRILDAIDELQIIKNPKPVIGFSDNSALLLDLYFRTGLACIHGPMVASVQWTRMTSGHLAFYRKLLFEAGSPGSLPDFHARSVHAGVAEGRLIPCNLTLLIHMLAAGRIGNLNGSILVLEDVGEAAYRVDRMLNVLRLAGVFTKIAGLVLGDFEGIPSDAMDSIIEDYLPHFRFPILADAPIGHGKVNIPIPVGVRARIDGDNASLEILESPVC